VDWVKLSARYYLDVAIAGFDDATEVMFTRALAYSGDQESHGFIPSGMLPALCRRRRYETCVEALVACGLWSPVRGGYKITRWQDWQSELEALSARRSADRDRKRRERERASTVSRDTVNSCNDLAEHENPQVSDMSRDMSAGLSAPIESKNKNNNPPNPPGSPPPRKRACRLPGDFDVTPDMVAWARQNTPHVDGRLETERFRDYWHAKAGRDATKLDWPATWRNWMRRAAEQQPAPRGRHLRQPGREELFADARARENGRTSIPAGELE
jgi:hypothetical protein